MTRLAVLLLLAPGLAPAQSGRAELFGAVRDPAGLPVPSARVDAEEAGTGLALQTITTEQGAFHFFGVPPGTYRLTVAKSGFTPVRRTSLQLRIADRVSVDFILPVGEFTQTIEVHVAAPLLEANTGTVSFSLDRSGIATLPLDGRNFIPLLALAPGVAIPPGSLLPRISGNRPRVQDYIYDGVSVLQPEPGQVAYFPIIDAIEEFRVQLNSYSAEYGRSSGGIIQVNTKSGTNEFHGTLFEFFRNEHLNARNLFAPSGPKPAFKRNQYGFVFGGPIERNKTFFFLDWQGTRLRVGNTRISTVPTLSQREGIFATPVYDPASGGREAFPNNIVPKSRFDSAAAGLFDRYPAPTSSGAANNYRRVGTDRTNQDLVGLRLDRYFGSHHRVFGRYTRLMDDSAPTTPLPDGSGAISSGVIGDTVTRADSVAADHTYTISPAAVNQLRFGFTRRGFERSALNLPIYQIAGFQQLGPAESANASFSTSVMQILDTFSLVRANHSLKFGADIRLERMDAFQPPNPLGLYSFNSLFTGNSLASFLLGQVNSFNIDVQGDTLKPRARIAEFFVQDDWRASPRLTLGLGLRYTLNFPSTEVNNRGAIFNLQTQQLDLLGVNGYPRTARNLEHGDFGPRVTLAYKLSDDFVVRSGYGLVWIEQAGITTPFTIPSFPFLRSIGQRSLDNLNPAFVLAGGPSVEIAPPDANSGLGQGVFSVDRRMGSGYAQQWNFTLQKTFGESWNLEVGYLGAKSTHLGVPDTNLNQLPADTLSQGKVLTDLVANPFFGEIPASSSVGGRMVARQQLLRPFPRFTTVSLYRNNIGGSSYHGFQGRLEKRLSTRLTFTGAYTFSKLIDDASSVFDAAILTGPVANFPVADSLNRHLEKDLSNGDIPHVFSASFLYSLGRGWQIGGILRAQSGMPLAVTQVTNYNAFAGYGTQRPNRIADPNLDQRTTARWFNTAAFTTAPQFVIGNSSRNPVRGPAYQAADLMLGKSFHLSERARLESRAEVFNVANTPPLGQPNGVLGNPAFGAITSALDPRVVEFALKLLF